MLFLSSSLIIEYTPFLFLEYPWLCIFHIIYVFTVCELIWMRPCWLLSSDHIQWCREKHYPCSLNSHFVFNWKWVPKLTSSFCQILWWNIIVSIKYALCENISTIQPCLPFEDGTDLCIVDDSDIEGILCILT